jgi:hypothetical protein
LAGVPELAPRFTGYYCVLDCPRWAASILPRVTQIRVRLPLPMSYSTLLESPLVGPDLHPQEWSSPKGWHHRWKSSFRIAAVEDVAQAIKFIRAAADLPSTTKTAADLAHPNPAWSLPSEVLELIEMASWTARRRPSKVAG